MIYLVKQESRSKAITPTRTTNLATTLRRPNPSKLLIKNLPGNKSLKCEYNSSLVFSLLYNCILVGGNHSVTPKQSGLSS